MVGCRTCSSDWPGPKIKLPAAVRRSLHSPCAISVARKRRSTNSPRRRRSCWRSSAANVRSPSFTDRAWPALAKAYDAQGVQFLGIDANQQDGISQIAQYAKDAAIEFPILKDVNNALADQLGVERHHGSSGSGRRANDPLSRASRRSIQRRHFAHEDDAKRPQGGTR